MDMSSGGGLSSRWGPPVGRQKWTLSRNFPPSPPSQPAFLCNKVEVTWKTAPNNSGDLLAGKMCGCERRRVGRRRLRRSSGWLPRRRSSSVVLDASAAAAAAGGNTTNVKTSRAVWPPGYKEMAFQQPPKTFTRGKKCTRPSLSFTCIIETVRSSYQENHKTTRLSNSAANIMVWLLVWWLTTELNLTGINWGLTHERSAPTQMIVIPELLPHTVVSFFRFWGRKRNTSWAETASELSKQHNAAKLSQPWWESRRRLWFVVARWRFRIKSADLLTNYVTKSRFQFLQKL